eukprot:1009928-Amphidinium_carterae.1
MSEKTDRILLYAKSRKWGLTGRPSIYHLVTGGVDCMSTGTMDVAHRYIVSLAVISGGGGNGPRAKL